MTGQFIRYDHKTGFAQITPEMVIAIWKRLDALEDAKSEPLTFPKIDASALPEPKHPFEPFPYTERS